MIAMIVRIVMIVTIVMMVMIVMIVKKVVMIVEIVKNGVDCCGVVTCRMLPAAHPGSNEGYNIFLRYIVMGFMKGYDIFLKCFVLGWIAPGIKYCGFCSKRIVLYFPMCVSVSVSQSQA